ncbi:30S ribosomal protein S19 [Candidatus Woesearchaeota archaeon]|nr:30S ribosomal protein S19 [Candidatus Woesearchaeota archaeon]
MAKEYTFRGRKPEELKNLSLSEFAEIATSAVRRKIKRGFTESEKNLLERLKKSRKDVKTHCRDMIIIPELIDKTIRVYSGKDFIPITFTAEMLGHRIGEFAHTRKPVKHSSAGVGATRSSASRSVR